MIGVVDRGMGGDNQPVGFELGADQMVRGLGLDGGSEVLNELRSPDWRRALCVVGTHVVVPRRPFKMPGVKAVLGNRSRVLEQRGFRA